MVDAASGIGLPVAFGAGLISFLSPCVLPLVPGYLSLVSAGEAARLGEPGVSRRVVAATLPFFAGFTVVFVALGAAAAFVAAQLGARSAAWIAGSGVIWVSAHRSRRASGAGP